MEESVMRHEMDQILSRMGIPQNEREKIVRQVGLQVREVTSSSSGGGSIGILVDIKVFEWEEVEDLEEVRVESMEGEAKLIPATKQSIEALERMLCDNLENLIVCTICMEEIEIGVEVIRMLCSHLYHGDCIVKWLQNSHVCPLCRYVMPVEH